MSKSNAILSALVAAAGASLSQPVLAHTVDEKLGKVHFETSCTSAAGAAFDQGMLYQHSFWYSASQRAFNEALEADPKCGIAYWGIALALLWNPHVAPPAKNLAEGAAIIAKGQQVGAATERERDYLTALSAMYADYEKVDHRTRVLNYVKAMEQLAAKYPNDDEAQIHYALSLNVECFADRQDLCQSAQGCRDPGDDLDAQAGPSWCLALPDSPLRHTGIGREGPAGGATIREGGTGCAACTAYAVAYLHAGRLLAAIDRFKCRGRPRRQIGQGGHDQLHAMDYEVYAFLQLGQDAQAKAVIDDMVTVAGFAETFPAGPFALAASPARYAVERGNWKEAAALEVRPSPLPYVTAISWFAKALGAARSGDTAEAQAAIAHLIELRDQLREKKDAYWSEQVDIQARVATAWTQYAAGHQDEALKALSDAADAEHRTRSTRSLRDRWRRPGNSTASCCSSMATRRRRSWRSRQRCTRSRTASMRYWAPRTRLRPRVTMPRRGNTTPPPSPWQLVPT